MFSTFLMGVIYMAIISVLVRPSSKFSTVIGDVSDSLASLTQAAVKGQVS